MPVTTSQAVARAQYLAKRLTEIAQGQGMLVGYDVAVDQQVGTNESQWRREVRAELRKSFAEGGKTEAYRTVGGVRVAIRGKTKVPEATVKAILHSDVERVERELSGGRLQLLRVPQMFAPIATESQVPASIGFRTGIPAAPGACAPGEKAMLRVDGSTVCIPEQAGLVTGEGVVTEEEAFYPPPPPLPRTTAELPPEKLVLGMSMTTALVVGALGVGLLGGGIYLATRKKKR